MSRPGFKEVDFGAQPPNHRDMHNSARLHQGDHTPQGRLLDLQQEDGQHGPQEAHEPQGGGGVLEGNLTIPTSLAFHNTIKLPAIRSPDTGVTQFMRNLSAAPVMERGKGITQLVRRRAAQATVEAPVSPQRSQLTGRGPAGATGRKDAAGPAVIAEHRDVAGAGLLENRCRL